MASPEARSNDPARASPEKEKPSFSFDLQAPRGVRRQLDPLENKVRTGNEKRPFISELIRFDLEMSWSRVRRGDRAFDMKVALAA
jgi:hypothetical protein